MIEVLINEYLEITEYRIWKLMFCFLIAPVFWMKFTIWKDMVDHYLPLSLLALSAHCAFIWKLAHSVLKEAPFSGVIG